MAALLESRDKVVDDVGKAEGRYRSAGSALTTYATALDRVQTETLHALTQARSAKAEAEAEESLQHRYHTSRALDLRRGGPLRRPGDASGRTRWPCG